MQASYQMHQLQMAGAGARAFDAAANVCPIPAFHVAVSAGSWSSNDLTTRKPGPARLTSASAT